MRIKAFLLSTLAAVMFSGSVYAGEGDSTGTTTIPLKEYEKLKEKVEADKEKQHWNMSFEQILEKEDNNYTEAWEKYEFWNLRTIRLKGTVGGSSVTKLIRQISTLNEIDKLNPIIMIIDSPGGAVFPGFNLINAMNNSFAPIHTVCDGLAVSMAAVVLSNGSQRYVNSACIFMIHEVAGGGANGQTTDQIKTVDRFINVENILARILSDNSGLSVKDVRAVWEYETFYNAHETVMLGFADEVVGENVIRDRRTVPYSLLPLNKLRDSFNERLTK